MLPRLKSALKQTLRAPGQWLARRRALANTESPRLALASAADLADMTVSVPGIPGRELMQELAEQDQGRQSIVLVRKGAVLVASGFVHWPGPRYASAMAAEPGCPEIFRLHVLPAYRSMGLGSLMIDFFEAMARQRGVARIGLGVALNNPAALALYERLGYARSPGADFMDEFEFTDRRGQRRVQRDPAVLLVKTL